MPRIALAAISLALLTVASFAQDAPSGIKRTPLQSVDFPDGYKTVLSLSEVVPGAGSSPNSHPGLEAGYILEGEVIISVAGQPDIPMKAGDSYTIPAGSVHNVRTVGDKPSKIIATYVVERDKPLSTPAQ